MHQWALKTYNGNNSQPSPNSWKTKKTFSKKPSAQMKKRKKEGLSGETTKRHKDISRNNQKVINSWNSRKSRIKKQTFKHPIAGLHTNPISTADILNNLGVRLYGWINLSVFKIAVALLRTLECSSYKGVLNVSIHHAKHRYTPCYIKLS